MKEWTECYGYGTDYKTYYHPDGSSTTIGPNFYEYNSYNGIGSVTVHIYPN